MRIKLALHFDENLHKTHFFFLQIAHEHECMHFQFYLTTVDHNNDLQFGWTVCCFEVTLDFTVTEDFLKLNRPRYWNISYITKFYNHNFKTLKVLKQWKNILKLFQ